MCTQRIEITPVNLKAQRPIEVNKFFIELAEDHLRYVLDFLASEPKDKTDETLGWEDVKNNFDVIALKKCIAGLEKSWSTWNKKWCVVIIITGFQNDLSVYFKKEEEAAALQDKIFKWVTQ